MTPQPSHAGRFVWRELVTPSLTDARPFYEQLFGWSSTEQDMGLPAPYVMFQHAELDETVGGAMVPAGDDQPAAWLDYITIDDVDAALDRVVELGGRRITEAMDIPGVGRFAVVADPQGGVFSLFRGEDPGASDTERRPPTGTFCWSQLMTRDLDGSVAFYTGLLGWTTAPMGPGVVFMRGETMVSSALPMPADAPAPTHWLQYVAVDDTDAAWERALALGARGLKAPETMPGMGRFAVLTDPAGASFALWKDLSEA